jgi:thioredoxin-related protein
MKVIVFVMSIALFVAGDWLNDFEQAKQQAKEKNHMILLSFSGSDWCGPCIMMKREVFDNQAFLDFANSNLVLVKADFPRRKKNLLDPKQKAHNEKLAEQYNPNGKFPLTVLLDGNGKVVHTWEGYSNMTVDTFIKEIQSKSNGK